MQIKPHHVKQATITTLLWGLIAVIESISASGAYHAEADHLRGAQMAAMTVICAAIAFLGFGLAGRLKDDERPATARRALAARIVAASFLILGPVPFLGSALKMERLDREWSAYTSSAAYQADQQMALDEMADRYDREAARQRIIQPVNANLDPADGEFWVALLIQTLMIFASDALRVPAPITAEERQAMMFKERGRKAAATRKAKKAAKAAPKPRVIQGGKA